MKQTKCIALLVVIAIIASVCIPIGSVKAATTQPIQIKNRGTMSYFRYEGELVNQRYLMHEQDGNYHPVYRISQQTENAPENIQAEVGNTVMETKIYQIIQAGYPYKTASELGCPSELYAYIATQTAIDCYVRGYALEKLEPVSSSAEIIKQAISIIYENSATQARPSTLSISVTPTDEWNFVDEKEMQKNYQVTCNYDQVQYTVSTTQGKVQIRNATNEGKSIFSIEEPMRLAIAKEDLAQDIHWNTKVHVQKVIQDIYQTVSTSNGRTYALCEYQFTQEAETTWEEMLQAYVEEPEEEPEKEPETQPEEETQVPPVEDTKEPTQNTEDVQISHTQTSSTEKHNNSMTVTTTKPTLPRTGF